MSHSHIQFETLCVLAASGRLTPAELSDLRSHSDVCAACRERLLEMKQLSEEVFLACAAAEALRGTPKGMCERFVARANREGIQLRPRMALFSFGYMPLLSAFALLIAAVFIASTWRNAVSTRSVVAGPSQASLSIDAGKEDVGSAYGGQLVFGTDRVRAIRVRYRTDRTRTSRKHQIAGSVMTDSPHLDFVMYSPQPRFSSDSIATSSLISEGEVLKPWVERDPGALGHAFPFKGQKLLLASSSDPQQPLAQYACLPNGRLSFRFNLSDFREPQATTH